MVYPHALIYYTYQTKSSLKIPLATTVEKRLNAFSGACYECIRKSKNK